MFLVNIYQNCSFSLFGFKLILYQPLCGDINFLLMLSFSVLMVRQDTCNIYYMDKKSSLTSERLGSAIYRDKQIEVRNL